MCLNLHTMNLLLRNIHRDKMLFYSISMLFIVLNSVFIANEIYYFNLIPFFILVIFTVFTAIDKLMIATTFLVPISVPLSKLVKGFSFDITLPSEALIVGIMLIYCLKLLHDRDYDKKILRHPITIAVIINLAWIFFTSLTSSMPVVSLKFFLSRFWFVVVFFILGVPIFSKYKNIKIWIWAYTIPLLFVAFYTFTRLYEFGIENRVQAHWTIFMRDHTLYGCVLAFFIPVIFGFLVSNKYSFNRKILIFATLTILITAVGLTFTRAAWLSLIGAFVVWFLIRIRIKLKYLISLMVMALGVLFIYQSNILMSLEKNKQVSSTNVDTHIKSMSNIATDASNMERINRWKCALRMFAEKPLTGFGPGTYMFKYAPFQHSNERTIISTNAGDSGNAHSEFLGPLAESGIFGMLSYIFLVAITIIRGIKIYYSAENKDIKTLSLSILLGLITYFLHSFLNNYLDTDKASAPFWAFIAMIVALDIYHVPHKTKSSNTKHS